MKPDVLYVYASLPICKEMDDAELAEMMEYAFWDACRAARETAARKPGAVADGPLRLCWMEPDWTIDLPPFPDSYAGVWRLRYRQAMLVPDGLREVTGLDTAQREWVSGAP